MQLRNARMCLDCEAIHASAQCPVCASESFAFLSRWVPTQERRTKIRVEPSSGPRSAQRVVVGVGVLGGAAYLLNRWLKPAREKLEQVADHQSTGELR